MSDYSTRFCTAFAGQKMIVNAPLAELALAIKHYGETADTLLVFDDATGRIVDLDLRGSDAEIVGRLSQPAAAEKAAAGKTRGRPKLGVVAREVTLLPRQWDWLAAQPGGASATLRRLVEEARKKPDPRQEKLAAQEAAYRFMQALAGDLPGYEEAIRALFADDRQALQQRMAAWPADIAAYALRLASGGASLG